MFSLYYDIAFRFSKLLLINSCFINLLRFAVRLLMGVRFITNSPLTENCKGKQILKFHSYLKNNTWSKILVQSTML